MLFFFGGGGGIGSGFCQFQPGSGWYFSGSGQSRPEPQLDFLLTYKDHTSGGIGPPASQEHNCRPLSNRAGYAPVLVVKSFLPTLYHILNFLRLQGKAFFLDSIISWWTWWDMIPMQDTTLCFCNLDPSIFAGSGYRWCGSALIVCGSGSTKFVQCGSGSGTRPDPGQKIFISNHLLKIKKEKNIFKSVPQT